MLRKAAAALLVVLLVAGSGVVALSVRAADGVVHPERKLSEQDPSDLGLAFERVTYPTADGVDLVAWWIPAESPRAPSVVFLHGYGEGKYQGLRVAASLHESGYSVLLPDFRAHGESGGDFTTVGIREARDVAASVAWLQGELPCDRPRHIALVGWSMGGAAALNAAPDLPVDAVVTDSTFADLSSMVGVGIQRVTGLPAFPFAALTVFAGERATGVSIGDNRPAVSAARVEAPLLVVHGTADDFADHRDAARIQAASPGARLLLVQGAGHVGSWDADPGLYRSVLLSFLEDAFARSPQGA